jgi:hypothetical protein
MTWAEALQAMERGSRVRLPEWEKGRSWSTSNGAIMEMIPEDHPLFGDVPVIMPARITGGHTRSTQWEVVE